MVLKRMDASCCCRHNQYRDEIKVPGTWYKITTYKTLCLGYVAGCPSTRFVAKGVSYEHSCRELKRYQKGNTHECLVVLQWIVLILKVSPSLYYY